VQGQYTSPNLGYLPQIVDPMTMIGMIMGNDHAIDVGRPGCEQLLAKIRTAIHQQRFAAALDQNRRARPPVSRFVRVAVAPVVADPRNPG
jgi:hypothetical protein